ncbi:hypothetical protein KJ660_04020 [Candidatus Micrarchaeota archaeon]|nr:hypothetical protein [Candidatus Micrarchaeota archaeon]
MVERMILAGFESLGANTAKDVAVGAASTLVGNPLLLLIGIVLIVATIAIIFFLKKIIINSVVGLIVWGAIHFIFNITLPFWPTLLVTAIFGLAGIGVMLVLRFLGIM